MSTQNLTLTRATDTAIDFTYPATASTTKLILIVFKNGGVAFVKKSVPSGGASGQITLVPETKFTVNFKANEVEQILDGTITHKVIDETTGEPVQIFNGSVTVEENEEPIIDYSQYAVDTYAQKKTFDITGGNMGLVMPANSIITHIIIDPIGGAAGSAVRILNGDGEPIAEDISTSESGKRVIPIDGVAAFLRVPTNLDISFEDDCTSCEITVVWQVLPV